MYSIDYLAFDSHLFKYRIGRLSTPLLHLEAIPNILMQAREDKYHLVYIKTPPSHPLPTNISLPSDIKLILADQQITYRQNLSLTANIDVSVHISRYQKNVPNKRLYELALESGAHSRFKNDPNCVEDEFERLYNFWIENEVNGINNSIVSTYYPLNDTLKGFITLSKQATQTRIGLLSVEQASQGLKIEDQLIKYAIYQSQHWKLPLITATTQKDNTSICECYERCGFSIKNVVNIYHLWLPKMKKPEPKES